MCLEIPLSGSPFHNMLRLFRRYVIKSISTLINKATGVCIGLHFSTTKCFFSNKSNSFYSFRSIFSFRYAYTGRPVIVTDAMTNWSAPSSFSFEFFKVCHQPFCFLEVYVHYYMLVQYWYCKKFNIN